MRMRDKILELKGVRRAAFWMYCDCYHPLPFFIASRLALKAVYQTDEDVKYKEEK